jgi:predicted ribosome quality control (RQC) complex YloA/Tae2 family protein
MTTQRRVNWTISEAAYEAASEMSDRYGSLTKVVEIAIDRMYREEIMKSKLGELMDKYKEAEKAENRKWQNRWASKRDIEQAEREADEAYEAVADAIYSSDE